MQFSCRAHLLPLAALLLVCILVSCFSLSVCHGKGSGLGTSEKSSNTMNSRKLMATRASVLTGFDRSTTRESIQPKKAVEPSLRRAPKSGPNPTQNK
ncbi:hypothetical protein NL676_016805 [Syzygium grande]|nr:hypothetical protein NL676_016805 [Syzygium grande]